MKDIHDYKESTITLQLGEAIAENKLAGIQEMWSQGRRIIGKIRNNLLELKTYRDTRDYGYDEQNDITKKWASVKKALINGEIPEFAKNHPKETKENKEAKEEVDNKEREKTEEMEKTTETMTNSDNHLKETKENKVAEEEVEMKEREKMTMDEILSEGEKYMEEVDEVILVEDTPQEEVATLPLLTDEEKEITESKEKVEMENVEEMVMDEVVEEEEAKEEMVLTQSDNWWTQYLGNDDDADDDTQFNDDLDSTSPITENSEFVTLCKRNGYKFEAVMIRNEASNTIQSCAIYAVEESTGRRLIDANGGLSVSREKIMNTENYKVMNFMRKFDVNFNEDDLKTAFNRLKDFIETSKSRVDSGELSIEEALDVFQQLVIQRANAEENNSSIKERNYMYNAEEGYAQVRVGKFQQVLNDAGTGFKRRKFCLGLRMLEKSTGQVIIKGNRSKGYGFVDSNSQSWFRFTA